MATVHFHLGRVACTAQVRPRGGVLRVICAACLKELSTTPGKDGITYDLCPSCAEAMNTAIVQFRRARMEAASPSRTNP
jgi:hypothetical protein